MSSCHKRSSRLRSFQPPTEGPSTQRFLEAPFNSYKSSGGWDESQEDAGFSNRMYHMAGADGRGAFMGEYGNGLYHVELNQQTFISWGHFSHFTEKMKTLLVCAPFPQLNTGFYHTEDGFTNTQLPHVWKTNLFLFLFVVNLNGQFRWKKAKQHELPVIRQQCQGFSLRDMVPAQTNLPGGLFPTLSLYCRKRLRQTSKYRPALVTWVRILLC